MEQAIQKRQPLAALSAIAQELPWGRLGCEIWEVGKNLFEKLRYTGTYEVLEYETTLELHDTRGRKATVRKREKVRYLQDNIIAYQDQAWGDGKILLDYRCSPGKPVDRYRSGHKTLILISLREVKNRGDVDEFNFQWGMRNGFTRKTEQWETDIRHRTKRVRVRLIFPKERPPLHVSVVERNRQKTYSLGEEAIKKLPDGRWSVLWEKKHPRVHEHYILKWEW